MKIEHLKEMIENVGKRIPEDGDWKPTLILESKSTGISIIGVDVEMKDQLDRDIAAGVIRQRCRERKADTAVWINTAWQLVVHGTPDSEQVQTALRQGREHTICERDDKREVVAAVIATRDGQGDGMIVGDIIRSDSHPRVKWHDEPWQDTRLSGTFPEALKEGVRSWKEDGDATA